MGGILVGGGWVGTRLFWKLCLPGTDLDCLFFFGRLAGLMGIIERELSGSCFLVPQLEKGWCWLVEPSDELT